MLKTLEGVLALNGGKELETEAEKDDLPTIEEFIRDYPLYSGFEATPAFLKALRATRIQLDMHCMKCSRESTFKGPPVPTSLTLPQTIADVKRGSGNRETPLHLKPGKFSLTITCSRTVSHYYDFVFLLTSDGRLRKIGQWPALADIAEYEIRKYRPLLTGGRYGELARAIGLASHGVGIGAFVYLRRIFESLIAEHRVQFEADQGEIEGFDGLRMDEKINALSGVLPDFLVTHRETYGILSLGLHQLDDDTCLLYFDAVKDAIVLILEQDLQAKKDREREKKLSQSLKSISSKLGKAKG